MEELQFLDHVRCSRRYGLETVEHESSEISVISPSTITILPTLPEPESCSIDASAWTGVEPQGIPVTVKIEVIGNRSPAPAPLAVGPGPAPAPPFAAHPAWNSCAGPSVFESGHTQTLGETCAKARLIITTAWNRPPEAGHSVRALGFTCRRTLHGRSARVRCVKGTTIVKAAGLLPSP